MPFSGEQQWIIIALILAVVAFVIRREVKRAREERAVGGESAVGGAENYR